jgi:hypothetical protein
MSRRKKSTTDLRVELGAAGTEALFAMQEKVSSLFGLAPSKATIIRRAVMLLGEHLDKLDMMDPSELQLEEVLLHRIGRSA